MPQATLADMPNSVVKHRTATNLAWKTDYSIWGEGGVQIWESPLNLTILTICHISEAPKKSNSYSFGACSSFNVHQGSNQHPALPRYFPKGGVVSDITNQTQWTLPYLNFFQMEKSVYLSSKIVSSHCPLRTITFQQSNWETQVYYKIIINSCVFGCSGTCWTPWIFFLQYFWDRIYVSAAWKC